MPACSAPFGGERVVASRSIDLARHVRPSNSADHLGFAILTCRIEGAVRSDRNRKGWRKGVISVLGNVGVRQNVAECAILEGQGDCGRRVAPIALGSAGGRGRNPDGALIGAIERNGCNGWYRCSGRRSRCRTTGHCDHQDDVGKPRYFDTHCYSPKPGRRPTPGRSHFVLPKDMRTGHRPQWTTQLCDLGRRPLPSRYSRPPPHSTAANASDEASQASGKVRNSPRATAMNAELGGFEPKRSGWTGRIELDQCRHANHGYETA